MSCFQDAECIDAIAPEIGAKCPPCPTGYSGDGSKCAGMSMCVNVCLCVYLCKCVCI